MTGLPNEHTVFRVYIKKNTSILSCQRDLNLDAPRFLHNVTVQILKKQKRTASEVAM